MNRAAVIDTNVVVAGLLTRPGDSPVVRVVDGMLAGSFRFLLSIELLEEYRRVLLRPRIADRHGLSGERVDVILTEITANAMIREPVATGVPTAPDRSDDHLWRLLATTRDVVLVTGDRVLLEKPPDFASVISPRQFVESLAR